MCKFAVLILLCTINAQAFEKSHVEYYKSPQSTVKKAVKLGIYMTAQELQYKREIQKIQKSSPKKFQQMVLNDLENPADYQGYLYEVYLGKAKSQKAKKLAQYAAYHAVLKNWKLLKTTVINESAVKKFSQFKPVLLKKLQNTQLILKKNNDKIHFDEYRFVIPDIGAVVVSKNLKRVEWDIRISNKADRNKLIPGAEDIQVVGSGKKKFEI